MEQVKCIFESWYLSVLQHRYKKVRSMIFAQYAKYVSLYSNEIN